MARSGAAAQLSAARKVASAAANGGQRVHYPAGTGSTNPQLAHHYRAARVVAGEEFHAGGQLLSVGAVSDRNF